MLESIPGLWSGLFALILWSSTALAYIPPSQFIVKSWVNKHLGLKGVRIKTLVTAIERDKPTEYHFKETAWINPETLVFKSFASDDRDEQDRKLYREEKSGSALPPIGRFLLGSDWREMVRVLRERGIPIRTDDELQKLRTELERRKSESESLMKWGSAIAWVIGSVTSKDDKLPQLWMEKDTFLPLRLVYTSAADGQVNDFRFDGYRNYRDFPYPRVVNLVQQGKWVFTSQILDIAADNDGVNFKGIHSNSTGFTEAGNSASSGLRSLIRLYYESFR